MIIEQPFRIGTIFDGLKIIEIVEFDKTDDYQPYLYMLEDDQTVWIPSYEKEIFLPLQ